MPGGNVGPYPDRGSEKFRITQQVSAGQGLQPGVRPPRHRLHPWLHPVWKERRPRDQGALLKATPLPPAVRGGERSEGK